MRRKRIPWYEPRMGKREFSYLRRALASNHPNHGALTKRLEQAIASRVGSRHAIAVPSGTSALFLALKGLGIGPGDEVVVPDVTFIATANAVDLCGAKPILADINPETLTLSPAAFKRAITKRTKAVIPVHVSGRGADMDAIRALARTHDIFVVEDAAEALLSRSDGRHLGTLGHAGCFSFSAMKIITCGQGGMVVTDDAALATAIRALRNQGLAERGTGGDDIHPSIGYNFKFTDIHAAVLLGQLHYLDARVQHSKTRHRLYMKELGTCAGLSFLPFNIGGGEFPLWTDIRTPHRDALDAYLRAQNMDCRKFWLPLHRQAPYRRPDAEFPASSAVGLDALWLPSAFTLSKSDIRAVSGAIKKFFNEA